MWGFRKFRELPAAPLGAATLVTDSQWSKADLELFIA